jgi:hypothetical protein
MTLPGSKPNDFSDARHMPATGLFKNALLNALGAEVVARLQLRPVTLELEHEMESPGNLISYVYFIEDGMASMTTTFQNGAQVEVGMFGNKSVVGVSALMGSKRSLNRIYTQIAGRGYASPVEAARTEFQLGESFQDVAGISFEHAGKHAIYDVDCRGTTEARGPDRVQARGDSHPRRKRAGEEGVRVLRGGGELPGQLCAVRRRDFGLDHFHGQDERPIRRFWLRQNDECAEVTGWVCVIGFRLHE